MAKVLLFMVVQVTQRYFFRTILETIVLAVTEAY